MKNSSIRAIGCCILLLVTASNLFATTYTVNSLGPANTGSGNSGTLFYCITQANLSAGPHTINFSVSGTISINNLSNSLPTIKQKMIIDATTAPGYVAGCAGVPSVILQGSGSGFSGIEVKAPNFELYGLKISGFDYNGIEIIGDNSDNFIIGAAGKGNIITLNNRMGISLDSADNGQIRCNFIGSNGYGGIEDAGSWHHGKSDNIIVENNYITNNGYSGILFDNASYWTIINNTITGNNYSGIDISGAQSIGNYIVNNVISNNLGHGIGLTDSTSSNVICSNTITSNNYSGVDIENSGNNIIENNLIGMDNFCSSLPNLYFGISLEAGSPRTNDGYGKQPRAFCFVQSRRTRGKCIYYGAGINMANIEDGGGTRERERDRIRNNDFCRLFES